MKRPIVLIAVLTLALPVIAEATSSVSPPANIRVTAEFQLQNEEQVWFCKTDSNVIVANWRDFRLGYRQIGIGRSIDGGQNWGFYMFPAFQQYYGLNAWQSDPTLTGDRLGNFVMTALDFNPAGGDSSSTIAVYRSIDKGETWTGPVPAVIPAPDDRFEDKQFTTMDRTGGMYDGYFYMAWARFPNPNQIMFVRSLDGGATFEPPIVVGPNQTSSGCGSNILDAGQFANVLVHESGDLHVLWNGFALDSGGTCSGVQAMKHRVSTDGGVTFGPEDTITTISGVTTIDGGVATYSQAACDADITGGPFSGNLYIAFSNVGPEDNSGTPDVDFIRSTDNGATWSERFAINDDDNPLVDNFHPWLIVNEEGVVIAIFYDQRLDDPGYFLFDLFATYSFDGGETFTTNHRLSSASSSPGSLKQEQSIPNFPWWEKPEYPEGDALPVALDPQAGLLGEYIGVTAFYDKLNAVWTDSRDGNSEIYTANWYLPKLEPKLIAPDSGVFVSASPDFKWATSWKHDQDRYRLEISDDPSFATITEIRVVDTNIYAFDGTLADGLYYWRVKTFDTAETDSSEYSEVWAIEVDGTAPAPLELQSPYDSQVVVAGPNTFNWTTSLKASPVTYDFSLFSDPPGAFDTAVTGLTESQFPLDTVDGGAFNWVVTARDGAGNETVSDTFAFSISCCHGETGDVNFDGSINLTDLTLVVNQAFVTFVPVPCTAEANTSGDANCDITLTDLTLLVNKLFVTFEPTAHCSDFDNTLCD